MLGMYEAAGSGGGAAGGAVKNAAGKHPSRCTMNGDRGEERDDEEEEEEEEELLVLLSAMLALDEAPSL